MTQLSSTSSTCEAQWKMWGIKVFSVLCFTAVCAAQEDGNAQSLPPSPTPTQYVPPVPFLQQLSNWLDVFPSEKVEFRCGVNDSSDWTFTWLRNGQKLQDPNAVLSEEGSKLTITAAQTSSGKYSCKGLHKTRGSSTGDSKSLELKVNENKPKPIVTTAFDEMYPGESVTFTCSVSVPSNWEYLWYHNGQEIQTTQSSTYTIASIGHANSGRYHCKAKRGEGPFYTEDSEAKTLKVSDPPKPSLMLMTDWQDVFQEEIVVFSCEASGFDWTTVWYKDGKEILSDPDGRVKADEIYLNITSAIPDDGGSYTCKIQHEARGVVSGLSDKVNIKYHDLPVPTLHKDPKFDPMYVGETVTFTCNVVVSVGWEYQWYKDGNTLPNSGKNISILLDSSHQGKYKCTASRAKTLTSDSVEIAQSVLEIPVPSLNRVTSWRDVFPSESVKLSCGISGSSGWTYTWSKDGNKVQADDTVSFDSNEANLSIRSASPAHKGQYTCAGHLPARSVSTRSSPGFQLHVYDTKPKVILTKDPAYEVMFPGESVSLSCGISVSSGWQYQWYKDGSLISGSESKYTKTSVGPTDTGSYKCQVKRGTDTVFLSDKSQPISFEVKDTKPKVILTKDPAYEVMYPGESVSLSCGISVSSGWQYQWYKDDSLISESGSKYNMTSVGPTNTGSYKCQVKRGTDTVFHSDKSQPISFEVKANKPKPLITREPDVDKVYAGESVSLKCKVEHSSGWRYIWLKDGQEVHANSNSFDIRDASSASSGTYECKAIRNITMSTSESSEKRILNVHEIPVPSLKRTTSWPDVFPDEFVKLSCDMDGTSEWTYIWYKDGVQADSTSFNFDGPNLSIKSASVSHRGQYNCSAKFKSRPVSSDVSSGQTLNVYDTKPKVILSKNPDHKVMYPGESVSFSCHINVSSGWEYQWYKDGRPLQGSGSEYSIKPVLIAEAGSYKCQAKRGKDQVFSTDHSQNVMLTVEERPPAHIELLTGWGDVFSTDSLMLKCSVGDNIDDWSYVWFREGQELNVSSSQKYSVTPNNDPEQSLYTCQGTRHGRPSFSRVSDSFRTKNLLLKRRILLSISGCIVFGIAAVMIGCIILRVIRKPGAEDDKPEEADLFLTMAQLKENHDAPCPLVEYITDEALNAPAKEGNENGTISSETTPLPITSQEDQAVTTENGDAAENNGGLVSFKS